MLEKLKEFGRWRIAILVFVIAFMGGIFYFFVSSEEILLAAIISIIAFKNRNNTEICNLITRRKWLQFFK